MSDNTATLPIIGETNERDSRFNQETDYLATPEDLIGINVNEIPTIGENALWYLNEVWWRLDYFHEHSVSIDHCAVKGKIKKEFSLLQLNAIQGNLVKNGVLVYLHNGFQKGMNIVRIHFKQNSIDELIVKGCVIKQDDVINLDRIFAFQEKDPNEPKKAPPSMYHSKAKRTANQPKEKRMNTQEKKTEPVHLGGNNLGVALAIWPQVLSGEYIRLDYGAIAKKTGVPMNQMSPILSGMCNKGILCRHDTEQGTFKKGNPNVIVWCRDKQEVWEIMAGVKVSHGKPISLDELFKPADDVITGDMTKDLNPDVKLVDELTDHPNGNGNGKIEQKISFEDGELNERSDEADILQTGSVACPEPKTEKDPQSQELHLAPEKLEVRDAMNNATNTIQEDSAPSSNGHSTGDHKEVQTVPCNSDTSQEGSPCSESPERPAFVLDSCHEKSFDCMEESLDRLYIEKGNIENEIGVCRKTLEQLQVQSAVSPDSSFNKSIEVAKSKLKTLYIKLGEIEHQMNKQRDAVNSMLTLIISEQS